MPQYFYGEDTYGARVALLEQAKDVPVRWVVKDDIAETSLSAVVESTGGLFGSQIVVLCDPSSFSADQTESLLELLPTLPDQVFLWERVKTDKRSKLWKAVRDSAREFSVLSEGELSSWLQNEATQLGVEVSEKVSSLLVSRVGADRWRLLSELQRLALFDQAVDEELVIEQVADQEVADIFPTLDALVSGNAKLAFRNVELLLEAGESEFYILSMLAYQFRVLTLVADGVGRGLSEGEIARAGKLHPFVVQKSVSVVRNVAQAAWREALTRVAATDMAIKQGKVDARTGLMMLLLNISDAIRTRQKAR